jgi:hypothetical protein
MVQSETAEQKKRSRHVVRVLPNYSRKCPLVHNVWFGLEKQDQKRTFFNARDRIGVELLLKMKYSYVP